jgi:hypothetical protein
MPDVIQLLTYESHKLMLAMPPHVKYWLKEKVDKVLQEPELTEAAVIKATKQVQQDLDLRLKSHPDAKNAMIGMLVGFCVLLRHEVREIGRLGHQPHTRQELDWMLHHMNNAMRLASLIQPLLKGSYCPETEVIMEALRRTR